MSALDPDLAAYFASLGTLFPPLPADPTPLERRARYWALVGLGRTPLPSSVTMNDVQLDLASGKVGVRLFYGHDGADEPARVWSPGATAEKAARYSNCARTPT